MKTLGTGHIPILGFGTWQLVGPDCSSAVEIALETGYRHIDTADAYGNHKEIGNVLHASGLPRSDIFLTSKIWRDFLRGGAVKESCDRFLEELQTDYLDLLLIHWPNHKIPIAETLIAMEDLRISGRIKAIGLSNSTIKHIEEALKVGVTISTNQVEYHPSLQQKELKKFCEDNGIVITAYSPIAQGQDFDIPIITELASKYKTSASQVILNWIMVSGMVAIPKATTREHIDDNFESLSWEMEAMDIERINEVQLEHRLVNPRFAEFNL